MELDLASVLVNLRATATQQTAMMKILKKNHEMQMQLVDMIAEVARAAPPPGQGTLVDKTA